MSKAMNDYSTSKNEIKAAVKSGDTSAYKDLRVISLEEPLTALLPWSKLMADKFKYAPACFDVYYIILTSNNLSLYSLDSLGEKDRKIAERYLILGAKKDDFRATEILDSLKIQWK